MLKFSVAVLIAILGLAGPASAGTFADGQAAYATGDYAAAMQIWKPLADSGDGYAQYELGLMYAFGKGVPTDYTEAEKWYRIAAEHGNAFAEAGLANLYVEGEGVPQDFVQAYVWLSLANNHGDRDAGDMRRRIAKQMTPDQISEAQTLARDWKPAAKQ